MTRARTIAVSCLAVLGLALGAHALVPAESESAIAPNLAPLALRSVDDSPVSFESAEIEDLATDALALISFDWQTALPGWHVEFVPGDGSVAGFTWSHEHRIEVFVRPSSTAERLARVLAHELGHAVDVSLNTPGERSQWLLQRSAPDAPWWPASGAADFETGAGDFAESFAAWQFPELDFRSTLGPPPSGDDLALLAAFATTSDQSG